MNTSSQRLARKIDDMMAGSHDAETRADAYWNALVEAFDLLDERDALAGALAEWLDADATVPGVTYTSRGGFGRGQSDLDAEQAQEDRIREAKRKARAALDGQGASVPLDDQLTLDLDRITVQSLAFSNWVENNLGVRDDEKRDAIARVRAAFGLDEERSGS